MEGFTPFSAIVGGALIGLSASLLWIANGRIAGVSGIVGGVLAPVRGDVAWRGMFLVGLLAAPLLYRAAGGVLPDLTSPAPVAGVIAAGLLVGFRSEEHTSELQSLMRISYAVFVSNKKKDTT